MRGTLDIATPDDAREFGEGDRSFLAIGGEDGIRQLCQYFYRAMDSEIYAQDIRAMHAGDLTLAGEKLTAFLCGWLGGPRRYQERFGSLSIPRDHSRFTIGETDGQAWHACMKKALHQIEISSKLRAYLLAAFLVPIERIIQFQSPSADSLNIR